MDCDDVMVLLAAREMRTLSPAEEAGFHKHVAECEACGAMRAEGSDIEWRWLVRLPAEDLDGAVIDLPMVDPIVFAHPTEIASGGMGRISRAFDRRLGREVAIKEVLSPQWRARFEREVRVTARLQHPAIVPIYEAGQFPDGSMFYAMRLIAGLTLQEAIDGARSLTDRLRLLPHVRAVTDALAYAHAHSVVHRDLKPANVLVGKFGETVVIDWGLAKVTGDHAEAEPTAVSGGASPALTVHGNVMGTPHFMSPEQADGVEVTAADDVYALGAILYTVLAGAPPYADTAARDVQAVLAATRAGPPTPLAVLAPEAPSELRAIAERALARPRSARFRTALELADELARFEAGQLVRSHAYTVKELVARWILRHRLASALLALAAVTAVVVAVAWTRWSSRPPPSIASTAKPRSGVCRWRGTCRACTFAGSSLAARGMSRSSRPSSTA